jgi:hypothetical protein
MLRSMRNILDTSCKENKKKFYIKTFFAKNRVFFYLTLNLLTTAIVAPPSNASKWQMGFNSALKGLMWKYIVDPGRTQMTI